MNNIQKILFDKNNTFKYILISVKSNNDEYLFLRGFTKFGYHSEIFEDFQNKNELKNFDVNCLGGGRIKMNNIENKMLVYGYSVSYGQADHNKVKEIILKENDYKDFEIEVSFEGY